MNEENARRNREVAEFALQSLLLAGAIANKKFDEGNLEASLRLTDSIVETVESLSRDTLENIILIVALSK